MKCVFGRREPKLQSDGRMGRASHRLGPQFPKRCVVSKAVTPSACTGRCCTNRHWPARCQSTGSSPADAIRHWSAEGDHPIEDLTAEDGLPPLPSWTPGAKAISDD